MKADGKTPVYFHETQTWARFWFRPLAVVTVLFLVLFGLASWSTNSYWIFLLPIAILAMLWCAVMITTVRADGVHIRYWPLHLFWHRHIRLENIIACQRMTLPAGEVFGYGYGIHPGPGGLLYNVRGCEFVKLKLANKKEIILGTQRPEELIRAIEKIRQSLEKR